GIVSATWPRSRVPGQQNQSKLIGAGFASGGALGTGTAGVVHYHLAAEACILPCAQPHADVAAVGTPAWKVPNARAPTGAAQREIAIERIDPTQHRSRVGRLPGSSRVREDDPPILPDLIIPAMSPVLTWTDRNRLR